MSIEALIFDCDGTLTDSMPGHYVAWHSTLARYGIEFSEDRFYDLAGTPTEKIVALLAAERGLQLDSLQVAQEKEAAFLESIHLLQAVPRVAQVVQEQQGRLKMAVASGGCRGVILRQLRQIGLERSFEVIVTAEDTQRHKPFPDVFLEAARRLGVAPPRCRVYEDADLGIEAARRAGMQCVDIREFHTPRRITA